MTKFKYLETIKTRNLYKLTTAEYYANIRYLASLVGENKKLWDFLNTKTDYFYAPASSNFHCSYVGGLVAHSINVFYSLDKFRQPDDNYNRAICARVALLHDLCKVNTYTQVPTRSGGKFIKNPKISGHGDRSIKLLKGILKLSSEEAAAIRWHMSAWDIKNDAEKKKLNFAIQKYPLVKMLIMADQYATYFVDD